MNELNGDYSVSYKHGSEKLTLNTNGTFTQIYTRLADARSTTNSGTWNFDKSDGSIVLRDVFKFDDFGAEQKQLEESVWQIRIAKRFHQISLIVGEEGVLELKKAK